jgi:hypothetical protein
LQEKLSSEHNEIEWLGRIIAALRQKLFGTGQSEKVDYEQLKIELNLAEVELEQFLGAVAAEAAQPERGCFAGLLLEDAGELVVGNLAAAREFMDRERAGHFLHDDLGDGFDDSFMLGRVVRILQDVLNAEQYFPEP